MGRRWIGLAALAALGGCKLYTTDVKMAPGAPKLPPSPTVEIVQKAPDAGTMLGTLKVQGNSWTGLDDCKNRLAVKAKEIGATVLVVPYGQEQSPDWMGQGPKCEGTAYLTR